MVLLVFLIANLITMNFVFSQGAAINSTGATANSSAMLDVSSTNQGILIPRMTAEQRNAIPSPAIGLLIYNKETNRLNYYKSSGWYELSSSLLSTNNGLLNPGGGTAINLDGTMADASAILDVSSTIRGFLPPRTTTASITSPAQGLIIYDITNNNYKYYNGSEWKTLCESIINNTTGTGTLTSEGTAINITGAAADASAMMDVSSSALGLLIPRMNSASRDLIKQTQGLIVYENNTLNSINFSDGTNWYMLLTDLPAAPTAGTHIVTKTKITWNWNAVTGATGYKYNTNNDWNSAIDNGAALEYIQTGLICNTSYNLYVWAYNNCGHSIVSVLNQKTDDCASVGCIWNNDTKFTVTHTAGVNGAPVTKTVTYGQVQTAITSVSHCWITQNLGADRQASSAIDSTEAAGGWYWQFNRTQGYKYDQDGVTRTPYDWNNVGDNTFTGWNPANDPCTLLLGSPWRMPTKSEWSIAQGPWADEYDAYASVLKLHSAGYLYDNGGEPCPSNDPPYPCGNINDTRGGKKGLGAYWSNGQKNFELGVALFTYYYFVTVSESTKACANAMRCLR